MATIGFGICLFISIMVVVFMAYKNYENINTYYWTLVILIPLVILGYFLKSRVTTPEAAKVAFCYIYLDSTVLLTVLIFAMLFALGVTVKRWIKALAYSAAFAHMGLVWYCVNNNLYYKTVTVIQTGDGYATKMTSGPLKIIHPIYLSIVLLSVIGILIASFVRKGTYSRKTLTLYAVLSFVGIAMYAIESFVDVDFSFLPYLYVVGDLIIAFDYDNVHVHDISCLISEQQKYHGNRGFAAFDLKRRFLSCNQKAFDFLPELKKQIVDARLPEDSSLCDIFYAMIDAYLKDGTTVKKFADGDITYACELSVFTVRKNGRPQGYLFDLRDATEEQKTLDVMTAYNETLNAEVEAKTANIVDIQRKIVIGMANIIENRDDNTGGHVKRTSDVIGIIVEEIEREGKLKVDPQFAADIVRAAPMHDLGKVTIDSSVLMKPDKLTDQEYAIMKTHPVKSGEMVKILLDGVEEEHFVQTAFRLARYHHERWDGKGYPEGLVGSMIPLEARIMAVADVYDALVSKRCYKEPMSFEEAYRIMLDGMGTQFDPNLRSVFLGCHEKLEDYYRVNNK